MRRRLTPRTIGANIGVSSDTFLGPNPNRHALILSGHNVNRVTYDLTGAARLDLGITIQAGGLPLILTHADFG